MVNKKQKINTNNIKIRKKQKINRNNIKIWHAQRILPVHILILGVLLSVIRRT